MGIRSSEKRIIASVYSGLGNRMRVLLSAQQAAALSGISFAYYWQIDHRFQARLGDLWEFDGRKLGPASYAWAVLRSETVDDLQKAVSKSSVVLRTQQPVTTCQGIDVDWKEQLALLVPTDVIRARVRSIWNDDLSAGPYVGVMVRAHQQSHRVTKETSPPSWFIERMLGIAKDNPGVKFFLSCDDPATQEEITRSVPNVISQRKNSGYNSREGVVDAVVDLYLAAFSSHIIGPHWSSFVDMAEALSPRQQEAETPVENGISNLTLKQRLANITEVSAKHPWVLA